MKKFNVYLPLELFERVKLMAKTYKKSITKMMVELIEIGYEKISKYKIKNINLYRWDIYGGNLYK